MEFWKWFFRGMLNIPKAIVPAIVSPVGEYFTAIILGVVAVVAVTTLASLWWLFLVIPVFIIAACHGYWRAWVVK